MPRTLFDKIWEQHRVTTLDTGEDLIAIDRVFLHERTGSVALKSIVGSGRKVRRPDRVFCTMDHVVSNAADRDRNSARAPGGDIFITATRAAARETGIHLIDVLDADQGIIHVISPELGIAQPGLTLVCPDSHTCSQGALGALATGIGSTDAEHAMVTGTLRIRKPPQMRITVSGKLAKSVTAKDLALHIIKTFGAAGAKRCMVEYAGPAIEALSIEERLTLCNMAVEFAAFSAVIAPDETTFDYLKGKRFAPDARWDAALSHWKTLYSDDDAGFDYDYEIDSADIRPTVTWGTSPAQAAGLEDVIPAGTDSNQRAMEYMGLKPGTVLNSIGIEGAFIGSCTNSRISDLRLAADILRNRKVADGVRAICVPGSTAVRRQAGEEGLDAIFKAAGFEWGTAGCALCFYAGGETFAPGTRVISSTNRNFEGRQGPGVRTHLASPAIVAASAVAGRICAPGELPDVA
ncbi:MAG: 3-isopropylmalate dehydratase large subunit [Hyphomonadaceae bacterium]|nr:3-isopropylmalate dehydratase large subunit [Hyphomonadaceae bacterium]MBC6413167.1 3-isopropylmalate dehydratase large subunit [Hyphomonadaceae bacterium]